MSNDLVSVIIPVFNGERFLAEAVESVIAQSYHPLEIIVVNDGSTDKTAEIAAGFGERVRYFYQANRGPAAARNRGIQAARGDMLCFLDSDDLWLPDTLAHQLARLRANPAIEVVMGYTRGCRLVTGADGRAQFGPTSIAFPVLSLGCAAIRRSAFDRVGLLDETLAYGEDVDWFMRMRERGVAALVHRETVQLCRRHERNMTNETGLTNSYFARALKQSLDRRRRQPQGLAAPLPPFISSFLEGAEPAAEQGGRDGTPAD
jgi:glycosyltransferase involved in cell wall biosynthesis